MRSQLFLRPISKNHLLKCPASQILSWEIEESQMSPFQFQERSQQCLKPRSDLPNHKSKFNIIEHLNMKYESKISHQIYSYSVFLSIQYICFIAPSPFFLL